MILLSPPVLLVLVLLKQLDIPWKPNLAGDDFWSEGGGGDSDTERFSKGSTVGGGLFKLRSAILKMEVQVTLPGLKSFRDCCDNRTQTHTGSICVCVCIYGREREHCWKRCRRDATSGGWVGAGQWAVIPRSGPWGQRDIVLEKKMRWIVLSFYAKIYLCSAFSHSRSQNWRVLYTYCQFIWLM